MFEINKTKYLAIELELPFLIEVENSVKGNLNGYLIKIDNIEAQIQTIQIFDNPSFPQGSKIVNDRYGLLSHSVCFLRFNDDIFIQNIFDRQSLSLFPDDFFNYSLRFLNKFILSYRLASNNYYVSSLQKQNFLGYIIHYEDENGETSISNILINQDVYFNGGQINTITKDQASKLQSLLITNEDHSYDDLLLSIYDNFDKGLFNISLIQCAIVFESYIYSTLKKRFRWSKTKIEKYKSIKSLCKSGLSDFLNKEIDKDPYFVKFEENVINIRNKLMHGEYNKSITLEECKNAIQSLKNVIKMFDIFFQEKSA